MFFYLQINDWWKLLVFFRGSVKNGAMERAKFVQSSVIVINSISEILIDEGWMPSESWKSSIILKIEYLLILRVTGGR